jgi:hypothetical protein
VQLNPVGANQNEVTLGNITVFFSYKTPVAYLDHETGIAYRTNKKWSVTTSKHINNWLKDNDLETVNTIDQSLLDGILK